MTILSDLIVAFDGDTVPMSDIYDAGDSYGYRPSSIRSALQRGLKSGKLEKIKRGVYKFPEIEERKYEKVKYAKRIDSTRSRKPLHEWNLHVETTCIGYVPVGTKPEEVAKVLNLNDYDKTVAEVLGDNGISVPLDAYVFDVEGVEMTGEITDYPPDRFIMNVNLTNNEGRFYHWETDSQTRLDDFV